MQGPTAVGDWAMARERGFGSSDSAPPQESPTSSRWFSGLSAGRPMLVTSPALFPSINDGRERGGVGISGWVRLLMEPCSPSINDGLQAKPLGTLRLVRSLGVFPMFGIRYPSPQLCSVSLVNPVSPRSCEPSRGPTLTLSDGTASWGSCSVGWSRTLS